MTERTPKRPFSAPHLQSMDNNLPVNTTSGMHQTGTLPVGPAQKKGCFNFRGILFIALCLFTVGCIVAIFKDGWPPNSHSIIFPVVGVLIGILGCFFAGIQILQGQQLDTFFQNSRAFFQQTFNKVTLMIIFILVIALITVLVRPNSSPPPQTPTPSSIDCGACNAFSAPDGEFIGISDGRYIFDTQRADNTFKQKHDWHNAIAIDENDAEALIYQENQVITKQPHLTFVVVTSLTLRKGSHNTASLDLGRTLLQGAFVAQREANSSPWLPGGRKVRLLIANAGDTSTQADLVAKQILQEARTDPNFAGVMGWPFSTPEALAAIQKLADQHIPMISPTASTDFSILIISTFHLIIVITIIVVLKIPQCLLTMPCKHYLWAVRQC